MNEFTILDWDSNFFGFRVARILPTRLDASHLESILNELRREKVMLAYWASDRDSPESEVAGNSLGGFLADRKTTYLFDLGTLNEDPKGGMQSVVEYGEATATEELEQLAIQSGEYSRFKVDPKIPTERFEEMYRLWIRQSVSERLADAVMVIQGSGDKVIGLVTLGQISGRGDIGLIAVDLDSRGHGYGRVLVNSSLRFFLAEGYKYSQVVTQRDNVPACSLYESIGYTVEKCENLFHFWLD